MGNRFRFNPLFAAGESMAERLRRFLEDLLGTREPARVPVPVRVPPRRPRR